MWDLEKEFDRINREAIKQVMRIYNGKPLNGIWYLSCPLNIGHDKRGKGTRGNRSEIFRGREC